MKALLNFAAAAFVVCFYLTIASLVIYVVWPVAVPAMFPVMVQSGLIAGKLQLWQAAMVSILSNVLFKSGGVKA